MKASCLEFSNFKLLRNSPGEISPREVCSDPLEASWCYRDLRATEWRKSGQLQRLIQSCWSMPGISAGSGSRSGRNRSSRLLWAMRERAWLKNSKTMRREELRFNFQERDGREEGEEGMREWEKEGGVVVHGGQMGRRICLSNSGYCWALHSKGMD